MDTYKLVSDKKKYIIESLIKKTFDGDITWEAQEPVQIDKKACEYIDSIKKDGKHSIRVEYPYICSHYGLVIKKVEDNMFGSRFYNIYYLYKNDELLFYGGDINKVIAAKWNREKYNKLQALESEMK